MPSSPDRCYPKLTDSPNAWPYIGGRVTVHTAGEALGKLLRTVYLCDYLGNPSFRREILDLLNQGEAVHSLQRAIQQGPIGAKRGRTIEQLAAISGALTLLANVIMAWNTHRMQAIVGRSPADYPDELIAHVAPTRTSTSTCAGSSRSISADIDPGCSAPAQFTRHAPARHEKLPS